MKLHKQSMRRFLVLIAFALAAASAVLSSESCVALHRQHADTLGDLAVQPRRPGGRPVRPEPPRHSSGAFVYLDSSDRAINVDADGNPRPATSGELGRARRRAYCSFGAHGDAGSPGVGAICLLPQPFDGRSSYPSSVPLPNGIADMSQAGIGQAQGVPSVGDRELR